MGFLLGVISLGVYSNFSVLQVRENFALQVSSLQSFQNPFFSFDNITGTAEEIVLHGNKLSLGDVEDTNSMLPTIRQGNKIVYTKKFVKKDLQVGNIIFYENSDINFIHRIVQIGNDGQWFAVAKGDNNFFPDEGKIRFEQIKLKVVGVLH